MTFFSDGNDNHYHHLIGQRRGYKKKISSISQLCAFLYKRVVQRGAYYLEERILRRNNFFHGELCCWFFLLPSFFHNIFVCSTVHTHDNTEESTGDGGDVKSQVKKVWVSIIIFWYDYSAISWLSCMYFFWFIHSFIQKKKFYIFTTTQAVSSTGLWWSERAKKKNSFTKTKNGPCMCA